MLQGLIINLPLMIPGAIEHAASFHSDTEIVARTVEGAIHRYTYGEAHARTNDHRGASEGLIMSAFAVMVLGEVAAKVLWGATPDAATMRRIAVLALG